MKQGHLLQHNGVRRPNMGPTKHKCVINRRCSPNRGTTEQYTITQARQNPTKSGNQEAMNILYGNLMFRTQTPIFPPHQMTHFNRGNMAHDTNTLKIGGLKILARKKRKNGENIRKTESRFALFMSARKVLIKK